MTWKTVFLMMKNRDYFLRGVTMYILFWLEQTFPIQRSLNSRQYGLGYNLFDRLTLHKSNHYLYPYGKQCCLSALELFHCLPLPLSQLFLSFRQYGLGYNFPIQVKASKYRKQNTKFSHTPKNQQFFLHFFCPIGILKVVESKK